MEFLNSFEKHTPGAPWKFQSWNSAYNGAQNNMIYQAIAPPIIKIHFTCHQFIFSLMLLQD